MTEGPASAPHAALLWHGGQTEAARRLYPAAPEPWLDLSTGIAPWAYPVGEIAAKTWTDLPNREALAQLEEVAARFFGVDYVVQWFPEFRDPLTPVDPDEMLDVDEEAALALADWFAFGFDVLEELRTHAVEGDEPSQVQLWPEHFDPATEMGDEGQGRRASFGASPGDPNHDLPYLYVSAWGEIDRSNPYWNDPNFNGSSLGYEEIRSSPDPKATALEFLVVGYRILQSG